MILAVVAALARTKAKIVGREIVGRDALVGVKAFMVPVMYGVRREE